MPAEAPDAATAFERLDVTGTIDGAFVVLDLTQSYRNASSAPVEAAYTFPLPVGAAVLGAWAETGEAGAEAALVDATHAEAAYEARLADGRATALVERLDDGLCGVSLGPLAPGGRARVRVRVGLLLETRLDEARLVLPTVVARPQGSRLDAKLAPHARPRASFTAEYPLGLNLELVDRSGGVEISSPSHDLVVTRTASGRQVALTGALDRDVVLVLERFEPGVRL
ncbi:MAG TPA: VIT domain-containing protein, partial [Caulobacteraceae bacterium]|nr:VIT domain-containing protein [Caulobacteraceae bacterium]